MTLVNLVDQNGIIYVYEMETNLQVENDSGFTIYQIAFGIVVAVIILSIISVLVYCCCCNKRNAWENKYVTGKLLGSGGFGAVHEVQRR